MFFKGQRHPAYSKRPSMMQLDVHTDPHENRLHHGIRTDCLFSIQSYCVSKNAKTDYTLRAV